MHDLRVALRRLRVILRAYAPLLSGEIYERFGKRLRAVAHVTNAARDAEVQIEWIDSGKRGVPPAERPGRRWLRKSLASERKAAYRTVRHEALPEFDRLAHKLRHALEESGPAASDPDAAGMEIRFASEAARRVREYATVLSGSLRRMGPRADEAEVHAARIAVKKLRYLVEPLVQGQVANDVLAPLRELQDCLGDLHDRHVMAQRLSPMLKDAVPQGLRDRLRAGLGAIAERNWQEACFLRGVIGRRYVGARARQVLRAPRDLARQLSLYGMTRDTGRGHSGRTR